MLNEAERNETVLFISFSYLLSDRPFYAWAVILQIDQPPALLVAKDKKALQSHFSIFRSDTDLHASWLRFKISIPDWI